MVKAGHLLVEASEADFFVMQSLSKRILPFSIHEIGVLGSKASSASGKQSTNAISTLDRIPSAEATYTSPLSLRIHESAQTTTWNNCVV